jgi:hypothetical protein
MKQYFAAAVLLLAAAPSWAAEIYTFSLIPANGKIAGAPGETIGWGYTIDNESETQWLVTTGLSSGAFVYGVPDLLFDFPILAPGASVTVPFDAAGFTGLMALTWDTTAPRATETGKFLLSAEWWSGDPFDTGEFVSNAPDADASYSAQVVPEPATNAMICLSLAALAAVRMRRRASGRAQRDARRLHCEGGNPSRAS